MTAGGVQEMELITQTAVITLSIGTPYLLTIHVLKFEIVHSTPSGV